MTEDDIKEAVSIAQADEFVTKMDGTYQAGISQGGTNVSGILAALFGFSKAPFYLNY